jgi:hypothetical protein
MQGTYSGVWREIASAIRLHLSADAFQRWFAAIELVHADECALTLQVPNSIYQFWIESNYFSIPLRCPCSGVRERSNSVPQILE